MGITFDPHLFALRSGKALALTPAQNPSTSPTPRLNQATAIKAGIDPPRLTAAPEPPAAERRPFGWCGHLRSPGPNSGAAWRHWGERWAAATQFSTADREMHSLCTNITQHTPNLFIAAVRKSWHISGLIFRRQPAYLHSTCTAEADGGDCRRKANKNPTASQAPWGFVDARNPCRGPGSQPSGSSLRETYDRGYYIAGAE